jgi:hypothetical protein
MKVRLQMRFVRILIFLSSQSSSSSMLDLDVPRVDISNSISFLIGNLKVRFVFSPYTRTQISLYMHSFITQFSHNFDSLLQSTAWKERLKAMDGVAAALTNANMRVCGGDGT